jgi:hypothetical protein
LALLLIDSEQGVFVVVDEGKTMFLEVLPLLIKNRLFFFNDNISQLFLILSFIVFKINLEFGRCQPVDPIENKMITIRENGYRLINRSRNNHTEINARLPPYILPFWTQIKNITFHKS